MINNEMPTTLKFIWITLGFVGFEILSYAVHRYLFHGILWRIHKTHHTPKKGLWETNDLFVIFFAILTSTAIVLGIQYQELHELFFLGLGATGYGCLYFFIHDILIHKRFFLFTPNSPLFKKIKIAHGNHHKSSSQQGQEPYGLFWFPSLPEKKQ